MDFILCKEFTVLPNDLFRSTFGNSVGALLLPKPLLKGLVTFGGGEIFNNVIHSDTQSSSKQAVFEEFFYQIHYIECDEDLFHKVITFGGTVAIPVFSP